jgi:hypothetical protein
MLTLSRSTLFTGARGREQTKEQERKVLESTVTLAVLGVEVEGGL